MIAVDDVSETYFDPVFLSTKKDYTSKIIYRTKKTCTEYVIGSRMPRHEGTTVLQHRSQIRNVLSVNIQSLLFVCLKSDFK